MVWFLVVAMSLVAATGLSARFLLTAVVEPASRLQRPEYNFVALRVSRWYRIGSWAVVTLFLLATLIRLFVAAVGDFL